MVLGILKEDHLQRVAITPAASKKIKTMGMTAKVEHGAGEKSGFSDQSYSDNEIQPVSREDILKSVSWARRCV